MNNEQIDLGNEPLHLTGMQFIGRFMIGLIIGGVISGVVFALLMFTGGMFGSMLSNTSQATTQATSNPIMALIFLVIGFVAVFLGSVSVAGLYNMFFGDVYYDFGMMVTKVLATNLAIFFIFAALYLVFMSNSNMLIMVLAFHIAFSVFISQNIIEFCGTINYASSHLIGTSMGLSVCILLFGVLFMLFSAPNAEGGVDSNIMALLIALPPLLSYTLIPFMHGIWSSLYYKIYEGGSNFMYIPGAQEVSVDSEEVEEVNIDQ